MSIVSFPLQDLLKSIEVDVRFDGYHATAYCQNRFTKEKFICLSPNKPSDMRLYCYFHELGHAIDHHLIKDRFYHSITDKDYTYIFGTNYGILGRYIRTEKEIVANKVAKALCVKFGIKMRHLDKYFAKRKAPKRLIRRVNAIMAFIESNS